MKAVMSSRTTADHGLRLLHEMMRIRGFDERCTELHRAGKIRDLPHRYVGQESVAVGAVPALGPEDAVVVTFHEHGQALARGMASDRLMAAIYGTPGASSQDHAGSTRAFDAETRFYGGSAIAAGGIPLAIELALAAQKQQPPRVTACFFGDDAVADATFHESLKLATLWKLPLLFLYENPSGEGKPLEGIPPIDPASKARSYGLPTETVDGTDVLAVEAAMKHAVETVKRDGPVFLEFRTRGFRTHSTADAQSHPDTSEPESGAQRDPIATFIARLKACGAITDGIVAALEASVSDEIDIAVRVAEAG